MADDTTPLPELPAFAACLNSRFDAGLSGDPVERVSLQLVEATALPRGRREGGPSFSLIFRGPREPRLEQRSYRLAHESLGSLDVFLVPLGPDGEGPRYEAVFN